MKYSLQSRLTATALTLSVHFEAFRLAPRAYLTAAKWWLLRKRVRAHGQFAPLLGQTSRAYEWWAMQTDAKGRRASIPGSPPIVALVAGSADQNELEQTLASLDVEGVSAHVINAEAAADLEAAAANIEWSASPWLIVMQAGDLLAPGAAQAYREAMPDCDAALIYADDDQMNQFGRRGAPHFKPSWNSELFLHQDFVTSASIIRTNREGLAAAAREKDWARALTEVALQSGGRAERVTQVLHHRRSRPKPQLPLPPLPVSADLPKVSVIVPTRNRLDLLSTCIAGLAITSYPNLEVIVVDNDSDDPATLDFLTTLEARGMMVLRHSGAFNYSAINNRAIAAATGELICLLNNDIEMLIPDWLAIMVTQALREEVGAVGAQLLYPDGRVQHAGVVIGVGNAAGHAHRFLKPVDEGYFHRHTLPQFVSAVTAACLVVRRDRFLAVGGLDERNFAVAFNDVDLCLKLNQRGWQSLYEPRAVLIHHESVSRGHDLDPVGAARFAGELAALKRIWKTDEIVDPFHHPQLSRASEQFAIAV